MTQNINISPDDPGNETIPQGIINLADAYKAALIAEQDAIFNLAQAQSALETEKVRVVAEAYALGHINGKNEAERSTQIAHGLEGAPGVDFLTTYAQAPKRALSNAEIERKSLDVEISLTKAWLYSQGGTR
jgi:hypothetical protein